MNPLRWLWRVLLEDDEPREPRPDEIVVLREVDGEGTAELWRGILEQRGIHFPVAPARKAALHGAPDAPAHEGSDGCFGEGRATQRFEENFGGFALICDGHGPCLEDSTL